MMRRGGSTSGSEADTSREVDTEDTTADELYNTRRDYVLPHLQEYYESQKQKLPFCWYCVCSRCICGAFTSVHTFRVRCLDWVSQLLFYFSGAYSPGGNWNRAIWDSVAVKHNTNPPGLDQRHNVYKRDLEIDTPHGQQLPIRVYHSQQKLEQESSSGKLRPLMLFIHGGGFCIGTRDQKEHDEMCSWYARDGFVVVGVSYRLAPEHPFPAAVQDCYDLMRWMADISLSGTILKGADRNRFVVAGDSAGGNLAAVLTCLNRDGIDADLQPQQSTNKVNLVYQVLIYPVFYKCPSSIDVEAKGDKAFFISKPVRTWFGESYQPIQGLTEREIVQRAFDRRLQPYCRPKGCQDLPPCTLISADCDLLAVEHIEVAKLLQEAGNNCRHHVYQNVPHGFATFDFLPESKQAYVETMKDMQEAGVFDAA